MSGESSGLRLLVLTQYWPPEMGAPQGRLAELGECLIDLGWSVEALTALPNYPTGRIFRGYPRARPMVEMVGRIRTVRVPLLPARSGFAMRLASYATFAGSASLFGVSMVRPPDLILVESPPLFIGAAALVLSAVYRVPYVFNVSDLWPESAVRMGIVRRGLATSVAEGLEYVLYRLAGAVTGQSDGILDGVAQRAPGARRFLVTNGVDPSRFGPDCADDTARALLGHAPGPIFIYAGLFGYAQGLDQLLDLARDLPADVPGRMVLVGDGPVREHLAVRIDREHLADRVLLLGSQPRDRIPALLGAADIALITLGMPILGAVPSKIYEAMAASLPILLVADGEPSRRVEAAKAGLTVVPGDRASLRTAFVRLATDVGLRARLGGGGRRASEQLYDRRAIASDLDGFLRPLIRSRARSG